MTDYYLVIDHDDQDRPYYIINQKATRWSHWQPSIKACFNTLVSDLNELIDPILDPADNETIIPIALPRYSYEYFSELYPEHLL